MVIITVVALQIKKMKKGPIFFYFSRSLFDIYYCGNIGILYINAEKGVFVETEQSSHYLDLDLLEGYLDSLGKTIVEQMFALYCQQVEIYLNDSCY